MPHIPRVGKYEKIAEDEAVQYVSYLLPVLALFYIAWFFSGYLRDIRPRAGSLEWITGVEKPAFLMHAARLKMKKWDWLCLSGLTLAYAAVAFFYLGDMQAPESFWKTQAKGDAAVVDFGRELTPEAVFYYPGLGTGSYTLEFSQDGSTWSDASKLEQTYTMLFKWTTTEPLKRMSPARYMRITADKAGLMLGELSLYENAPDGGQVRVDSTGFTCDSAAGAAIIDEQSKVPLGQTFLNSTYFDEIYHARTAYEHIENVYPYEITHPPLGKLILSVGIRIFGMTPFGWRFMGTLIGVLMLPVFYILIKSLFSRTTVALCATLVFAFDFMHFSQTRIATIDVYSVFFILLMYLFMWRYVSSGLDAPFKKTVLPLFLSGLFFGIGVASKWTCVYSGLGLLALYVLYLVWRGRRAALKDEGRAYAGFLIKTLLCSFVFFIVIPAAIYLACYIPYARASGEVTFARVLDEMLRNQTYMFNYHSKLVDTHPYASSWYTWFFDIRPILYYLTNGETTKTAFGAFGNPFVWWGGLAALGFTGWRFTKRRDLAGLFILIGYLSQLVPWMLVPRLTFIYHYFPSSVFLSMALAHVFNDILEHEPGHKRMVFGYAGAAVGAFALFYPVLAGVSVPYWYSYLVKWLPSWPF